MIYGGDVLTLLCPNAGWTIYGNEYENIAWKDNIPLLTKEQFEAGFKQVETAKTQAAAEAVAKRQALLEKLGITEDEARLLLGGN